MSINQGQLLWNRQHLILAGGFTTVDTLLQQPDQAFGASSVNEPPLGVSAAPPGPGAGTTPASRIQVIPLSPIPAWTSLTHGEPFVDPATGTVKVTFSNFSGGPLTVNVLFWDPSTKIGPGQANTYGPTGPTGV
jgi:hypothetical protein